MKIITWNINSVRLRQGLVLDLINLENPDIICLQETKTPDEHFPHEPFESAGYKYRHINGMKGYNGVAILSKYPFENPQIHHHCGNEDCRHIAVTFPHFTLHNIYIPAGGYEADPIINPKFQHKLDFVDTLTDWFGSRHKKSDPVIAVGDFNIAPFEHDVWSHKQLLSVVSHTPAETERMTKMVDALDWIDVARKYVPMDEKLYTWWSYRNKDWQKSNRGRRLDHIWVTRPLEQSLKSHHTIPATRNWDRPSDHIPVVAEMDV